MRLFDEIEKCFPAMDKMLERVWFELPHDGWPHLHARSADERVSILVVDELLAVNPLLVSLFNAAGVTDPGTMAMIMVQWMHFDRATRNLPWFFNYCEDTPPARK